MTRINTIPVEQLTDQHLMAEYRELPMVHGSLRRTLNSKSQNGLKTIPQNYTLNAGHVRFFFNKGLFLFKRYNTLVEELRRRNYQIDPQSRSVDWTVFETTYNGHSLNNDWQPVCIDHKINVERLIIRLKQRLTWYRFYGIPISQSFVDNLEEKYIANTNRL